MSQKMKLISCVALVCCFYLTEGRAGRVPDNHLEINDDTISDATGSHRANTAHPNHRLKRHSRFYNGDRDMDYYRYFDEYQDRRIANLEARLALQEQHIFQLLSRPPLAPQVYFLQTYKPSQSGGNETNLLDNKFNTNDNEPDFIFGSEDEKAYTDRPISLKPQRPSQLMPDQPPVLHSTPSEFTTKSPKVGLELCKTAILLCCDKEECDRKDCFVSYNCPKMYESQAACSRRVIEAIVKEFVGAYAPDDA